MTEQINILVVDDHAVVRTGISAWISSESDLFLSGEAADGEEAIAKVEALALRVLADRLDHGEETPELREMFAVPV